METSWVEHGNAAVKTVFLECFKMMWENVYVLVLTVEKKGLSIAW